MIANAELNISSIKKGPLLFVMILVAFIAVLNQTIKSVALPVLMGEFSIQASTAQWLTTGYMLVNGVLIPITAYLMQRFTTRELFQASMLIFLGGTVLSALTNTFELLLVGRMIQAVGGGIIMPLLMNVILTIFSRVNDAYLVIIGIGIVGLLLSFFIRHVGQTEEEAAYSIDGKGMSKRKTAVDSY
jgi:MFS family permease